MINYVGFACVLKLFSLNSFTKKMYRSLGNVVGARIRAKAGLPQTYIDRAKWILSVFAQYNLPQKDAKFLELGTGWLHWESTILRLFFNASITLYDVWDCRQFQSFKTYFLAYYDIFEKEAQNMPFKSEEACHLLEKIVSVNSFNQLYTLLGFRYVVDPSGTLINFDHETFNACFSYNVFEHIDSHNIAAYIRKLYDLLMPGGYSIEFIDISDHLSHYDRNAPSKNYLKYSDATWKFWFENDVQYFNRIQRGEWLSMFKQAGFELVDEKSEYQPVRSKINKKYVDLDRKDIECTGLKIIHRKPFNN